MTNSYILALDQGTSSTRALVFAADGAVLAVAQEELTQHYPHPGWVEHDPQEIADTQYRVAKHALAQANLTASDIAAAGLTNQRESIVVWDKRTGEPLTPVLVWQDRRTAERMASFSEADAARIAEKTGLPLDPYFSASKLEWLLDYTPGLRERAEAGEVCAGTIDTWVTFSLTEGAQFITDTSNASRTMLLNLHTGAWDDELLQLFRIPRAILPEVTESGGELATLTKGVLAGIPLYGILGDQQAATFGQACFAPGQTKVTYGTGCFLMMNAGSEIAPPPAGLIATSFYDYQGVRNFAVEGSVFNAGSLVQWLRDGLGMITTSAETETLAQQVSSSEGVTLVPAFTGLGAPYWDASARGLLIGFTRGTDKRHIARAALEAIALQVRDVIETLPAGSVSELRVDGGAAANDFLMQLQADLLNIPVLRPASLESTAFGVAALAGVHAGVLHGTAAVEALWSADRVFKPQDDRSYVPKLVDNWERAITRCRGWSL